MRFGKGDIYWTTIHISFLLTKDEKSGFYSIKFGGKDGELEIYWGHPKIHEALVFWTITVSETKYQIRYGKLELHKILPELKEAFEILKTLKNLKETK
jgi:hypothetical protein